MKVCQQLLAQPEMASNFIAGFALVLSCFSTLLALIAVWLQREHNRVSVKPLPDLIRNDYISEIEIKLHNHGLGPMMIEKLEVLSGNKVIADNLRDVMPDLPDGIFWEDFIKILERRFLAPGEEKILIKLVGDPDDSKFVTFRDLVRKKLAPLSINLYYKSIYDRKAKIFECSLEWYGRQH